MKKDLNCEDMVLRKGFLRALPNPVQKHPVTFIVLFLSTCIEHSFQKVVHIFTGHTV